MRDSGLFTSDAEIIQAQLNKHLNIDMEKNMPDKTAAGPYALLKWDNVWIDK